MTTILADFGKGMVVSDTVCSDGDRVWHGERKVYRVRKTLFAFAGSVSQSHIVLAWIRAGCKAPRPRPKDISVLLMNSEGLFLFDEDLMPVPVPGGIDAIGTGAKAALCAYEALNFTDPRKAVQIACKYDVASGLPVRTYRLNKENDNG